MEQVRGELESLELRERLGAYTSLHSSNHHNASLHGSNQYDSSLHNSNHRSSNLHTNLHNPSLHASSHHNSNHNAGYSNNLHNKQQRGAVAVERMAVNCRPEGFNSAELRKLGRLQTAPPPSSASFYPCRPGTKIAYRNVAILYFLAH
jgi:hypothetical protein